MATEMPFPEGENGQPRKRKGLLKHAKSIIAFLASALALLFTALSALYDPGDSRNILREWFLGFKYYLVDIYNAPNVVSVSPPVNIDLKNKQKDGRDEDKQGQLVVRRNNCLSKGGKYCDWSN